MPIEENWSASVTWPFLDWPHPIPFAHRGGAAEWPENTMLAFSRSVGLGYRYLETDVRVTADGAVVAFHDADLGRVSDRTGRLRDLSLAEVRQARVGGEPIPLLEDVLGTWPEARVYIDAKDAGAIEPLLQAVDRTGAHDRVCVGAFSSLRAHQLRRLSARRICTWAGKSGIVRLRLGSLGAPALPFAPMAGSIQVPVRYGPVPLVDGRFLAEARARGIAVHVFTVDDPAEMARLLDLGVDGILSNRPTVLRDVFRARGIWAP